MGGRYLRQSFAVSRVLIFQYRKLLWLAFAGPFLFVLLGSVGACKRGSAFDAAAWKSATWSETHPIREAMISQVYAVLRKGMTEKEVTDTLGSPDQDYTAVGANGAELTYVYDLRGTNPPGYFGYKNPAPSSRSHSLVLSFEKSKLDRWFVVENG
jgi:hypothetical protein